MSYDTRFFAMVMVLMLACSGITWHPFATWNKVDKAMLAGMVACQMADTGSTVYALHHGFHEANPLLPDNSGGIIAVKLAVTLIMAAAAATVDTQKVRRTILGFGMVGGCGPAIWNISHF